MNESLSLKHDWIVIWAEHFFLRHRKIFNPHASRSRSRALVSCYHRSYLGGTNSGVIFHSYRHRMPFNLSLELGKRLFIWGVLVIVVAPRLHIDRSYWTFGGKWSSAFRKLLGMAVFLNIIRLGASMNGHPWLLLLSDVLGIAEVFGLNFLVFYTPWVLRKWLEDRINIGGRPDTPLYFPLQLTLLLSIMGVILSRTIHPNFWSLKKVANIVSTPLIIQTIKLYNSVTSVGGHHHGRGTIMAQTLLVIEYWHLIIQLFSALGYALDPQGKDVENYSPWENCLKAFRDVAFVADWTRVLGHGIFLNLLDEMALVSPPQQPASAPSDEDHVFRVDEVHDSTELVSIIRSR
jgi:hypothetical protein